MARAGYVEVKYRVEGETKRRSAYGKTRREAQRKADVKKAMLEAGIKDRKSNMTVDQWCKEWLADYKEGTVSETWLKEIRGIVKNQISPSIGSKRLQDVKPQHLNRLLADHAHLSESHGKKVVQILRQIFDSAEANDLIDKDPSRRMKVPRFASSTGHRTITAEERSLTIRTAEKHPEGLFFLLMLYCGLRPQEVAVLQGRDIDYENRIIHVTKAQKPDGTIGTPKSDAGKRDVPIPLALDLPMVKPNEYLCKSAQGRPLTRTTRRRLWLKFKRWMEIENGATLFRNAVVEPTLADDLVPYCYRHTYCTDLQDAGVPLVVASRLMGHSDIKVTAKIYTHHSEESFEDARRKIDVRQEYDSTSHH